MDALLDLDVKTVAIGLAVLIVLSVAISRSNKQDASKPLPPGPKPDFLIGNLRQFPTHEPEFEFIKMAKEYKSDVLYFNVLGQPIIILTSLQAAFDILDKRGANYRDRPNFSIFSVIGFRGTLSFMKFGQRFAAHRKAFQSYFSKGAIGKFQDLQTDEARNMVKKMLENPKDYELGVRRFAVGTITRLASGYTVETDDDLNMSISAEVSYTLGNCGPPGGSFVDRFPFLAKLPTWLVRDPNYKFATQNTRPITALHRIPYDHVEAERKKGNNAECFIGHYMDQVEAGQKSTKADVHHLTLDDVRSMGATLNIAGVDTTYATITVLLLELVRNPEIQKKAHDEIDAVIGPDRLPTFDDIPLLPYIKNIVLESIRIFPVTPLAIPHKSDKEDMYNGMYIPAGSIVFANVRGFSMDERIYTKPDEFNPDRFIPKEEGGLGEPSDVGAFGFGRRVCVGQHYARNSLFIVAATLLACCEITFPLDKDGKPYRPERIYNNGFTSHPRHFDCTIKPRNAKIAELLSFH